MPWPQFLRNILINKGPMTVPDNNEVGGEASRTIAPTHRMRKIFISHTGTKFEGPC
jgi:hypothetical protein